MQEGNNQVGVLQQALTEDSKFTFYDGMYMEICPETKGISKDTFQLLKINGKLNMNHAYILCAINALGHATKDMILQWLYIQRRQYPKKAIPTLDKKTLKKELNFLAGHGMLTVADYKTRKNNVILIYTCTIYGHMFFKNILDMAYITYDENAIFHAEVETFKRLATASIVLSMAMLPECVGANINGRKIFGEQHKFNGYCYGYAEMNIGGQNKLYIVEPAFFNVDERITSQDEVEGRVLNRLKKVEEFVTQGRKELNMPVIPVFCVENTTGLKRLGNIASRRIGTNMYSHALFTSENVLYQLDQNVDECFLTMEFNKRSEDVQIRVTPVHDAWKKIQ